MGAKQPTNQAPRPAHQFTDSFLAEHAFTQEQLRKELGVSRREWFRRQAEGRLPPRVKVSKRVFFLKKSVLRWMEEQEQQFNASRPRRRAS